MHSENPTPYKELKPSVPRIYELYAEGAKPEELVRQMYVDYFSTRDNEKVCLGVFFLKKMGFEGLAQLRMMANGSDELSQIILQILDEDMTSEQIERTLGINRIEVGVSRRFNPSENLDRIVDRANAIGLNIDYLRAREILSEEEKALSGDRASSPMNHPQVSGEIERQLSTIFLTFGVQDVSYLEVLGPEEILRVRTLERPRMLLLGSMGVYSAREFRAFAEKLNANPDTMVIDLHPAYVSLLSRDVENNKSRVLLANAKQVPVDGRSFDHIYTNSLFRALYSDEPHISGKEKDIRLVIEEAFRILKDGGSMVCEEGDFLTNNGEKGDYDKMCDWLRTTIKQIGFKEIIFYPIRYSHVIRADVGSAKIDENGFPQYGDSLLGDFVRLGVSCRIIK